MKVAVVSVVGGEAATTPAGLLGMLPLHTVHVCVCTCACERQTQAERGGEGFVCTRPRLPRPQGLCVPRTGPAACTSPAASEFVPRLLQVLGPISPSEGLRRHSARPRPPSRAPRALSLCPGALVPFYPPWLGVAPTRGASSFGRVFTLRLSVLSWAECGPASGDTRRMLAE